MDIEQRLTTLEALVKRLTESAEVGGYTQARHERYMIEHAEWLQSLDKAIIETYERDELLGQRIDSLVSEGRQTDQRIKDLGGRIDSLVSSIGELISRLPPR
jgi:hypothetical protein